MSYQPRRHSLETVLEMSSSHRFAWALAILTYGLADVGTTMYFIAATSAGEGHPVVAAAIDTAGLWILIPWKLAAIGVLYGLYRLAPRAWRVGVPIGMVLLGTTLASWNTYLGVVGAKPF